MTTVNDALGYECWTCLDFGHLPGIGPCPDCQPDAYAEHIIDWLDAQDGDDERKAGWATRGAGR